MHNPCREKTTTQHAHDQQERLVRLKGWVVGFTDGEGCFSIGFVKQQDRKEEDRTRRGYKTGYQVFHEFVITQGESSIESLKDVCKFFGVGNIYINKRYDDHNEHLYRFVVRKRSELIDVIIPFFRENSLRTAKRKDFEKFAQCVELMESNKHLEQKGFLRIAKIAQKMNRKKSGKNLTRILRDHTSCSVSTNG